MIASSPKDAISKKSEVVASTKRLCADISGLLQIQASSDSLSLTLQSIIQYQIIFETFFLKLLTGQETFFTRQRAAKGRFENLNFSLS